jgi:hypothetical protein
MQLLPNGKQSFFDNNGAPLAGGEVTFYIPGTTTFKDTWQDKDKNALNTNPIILDAGGRAVIWGEGLYRQIVRDSLGNLIWDQLVGEETEAEEEEAQQSLGLSVSIQLPIGKIVVALDRAMGLLGNAEGSVGYAESVSEDGNYEVDLQKNGASIGTITFAEGANTATFVVPVATDFVAGDRVTFVFPEEETTLADIGITLTMIKP